MRNWVCKKCGLYKKINANEIKVGKKVYFIKMINDVHRLNKQEIDRGVVLSRDGHSLIILSNNLLFVVNDTDVYPEDAPVYFVYNMFGTCEC
ncbi:hypothetical protein ACMUMS_06085 [Acinetobacter courvalinii]|uniref:hypothetical protein n=1 Tax=Acinetobacter courvalinii TaxID=280147 RepID=UPI0021D0C9C0|nr:hypothetical protein [Acinetobacter courvalinii]MCU4576245.1 hypothetical protein [Acinetobacter courvalinii]